MQVRHDTSLLEQAVEHVVRRAAIPALQAEAEAARTKAEADKAATERIRTQTWATVWRGLALAAAVAIVVAGIGVGLDRQRVTHQPPKDPEIGKSQSPTDGGTGHSGTPGTIVKRFVKFETRSASLLGRTWELTAGHHFNSETDSVWTRAWCYTRQLDDGLTIEITLAERDSATTAPRAPIATAATLRRAGLTDAAAVALATKCPWLDQRNFKESEFDPPPGRANPFRDFEDPKPKVSLQGKVLTYSGGIGPDFLALVKSHDFDQLRIDSVGGQVVQALEAGSWLRKTGKAVEVTGDCLSACVFVLAGGSTRKADDNAKIGVHRFFSASNISARDAEQNAQKLSSEILKYFDSMGIDQALFHAMAKVPSDSMEYIAHDQLKAWKLLSEDNDELYRTTINDLSIRENADPISKKLGEIPRNTNNIRVAQCHLPSGLAPPNEWCHLNYNGATGWVNKRYLEKQQ